MKNNVLRDFTFVVLIYAVYFAISLIAANLAGDMSEAWDSASIKVLGVSLLCAIAWYVAGEWIMRPSASRAGWYLLWFILLLAILGTGLAVVIGESVADLNAVYFAGGAGAYYLATMLFSPFHAKYLIWPSTHIRTW